MKLITGQAFLFNLFTIWLQDTVGIIIYCHLFLNWCLVLWNQLKSHSAWKQTSFTWIDQLSSDTKPLVCPCSVHSPYLWLYFAHWRDPVTNGQLSRWQIVLHASQIHPVTIYDSPIMSLLRMCLFHSKIKQIQLHLCICQAKMRVHLGYEFYHWPWPWHC